VEPVALLPLLRFFPTPNEACTSSSFESLKSAIFFIAHRRSHRLPFDLPMEVQKAACKSWMERENAMHGNRQSE
jgi:hypothetical protein